MKNTHNWLDLTLGDIIQEYKNGSEDELLDGDDVDNLTKILNAVINLQEGNVTEDEYNDILDTHPNITKEDAKGIHDKLRETLIKYNCEEFGDCIVDDISWIFGFPTTIDVEPEID